jgi:hypothetical protein
MSAPSVAFLLHAPLSQVLVHEDAGWVVKWRENSAHALDVNCVEWAGRHTLVTAGGSNRLSTISSLIYELQGMMSASISGSLRSREHCAVECGAGKE